MASERTPLLEQGVAEPESALLPSLSHVIHSLSSHQAITAKHLHDVLSQNAPSVPVTRLYASLFSISLYMDLSRTGVSQPHMLPVYNPHDLIEELWTSYVESRLNDVSPCIPSDLEVQELLWVPILLDADGNDGPEYTSVGIQVADLLDSLPRTSFLLEQPCVSYAIELLWKYGPPQTLAPPPESTLAAKLRKLSASVSPRSSHLLDAVVYTSYIACQSHVAMTGSRGCFGKQDIWIIVYFIHGLLPSPLSPRRRFQPRKYLVLRRIGFILALLAYIMPTSRPKPETLPHALFLLSFGWNTFRLILAPAMAPGWIMVFPLRAFLVPALQFNRLLRPVVLQPFIYFLPLILVFGFLLNLSMNDLPSLQSDLKTPSFGRLIFSTPAPYDTREALFVFFLLSLVLLFFFSVASLIRVAAIPAPPLPSMSVPRPNSSPGDALSPVAARIVLRHTLLYTVPHFPAPLSLVLLIRIVPRLILGRIYMDSPPNLWMLGTMETMLWWVLIWPPSCLLSGLWGWGYNAPRYERL